MANNRTAIVNRLEHEATNIRRNVWRALHAAGSGHMGGSLSAADLLSALYFYHLRIRPKEPDWPDRDRFILSKGHANAALAAVLARAGFIDENLLDTFYGYESPLGMHPDITVPGVEMCTGGLGHGLAVGLGMSCGAKLKGQDFHTFVMLGDGELQEGSNWEAAMAAAHFACNNLTAIVDCNKIQQSGRVSEILDLGTLASKWEAFGWAVREIDGHDMWAIMDALDDLPYADNKPSLLIAHTTKGKGTSFAEDTHLWHNNTVTDAIYQRALDELKESE